MSDTMTIPTRHFTEGLYYAGKIKGQIVAADFNNVPTLTLIVSLEGQRSDHRNPDSGLLPCPKIDVEVRLRFPEDSDSAKMAARDLKDLGFESDDIELLNPESKKPFSLVGKVVHVTPKYKTYNERESCFWNLRFPRKREDRPIARGELGKSPAAKAFKEALKKLEEDKKARSSGEPPPF